VEDQELTAWPEHSSHLLCRTSWIGNGRHEQCCSHGLELLVGKVETLGVADLQINVEVQLLRALFGDGEHGWAQIDAGERQVGRVMGEACAGPYTDFQGRTAGARTESGPAPTEHDPIEAFHPRVVVAGRPVVILTNEPGMTVVARRTHRG